MKTMTLNKQEQKVNTCSEFAKSRIKMVYDLIFDYLVDLDVGNEEELCSLQMKFDKEKIAIPSEIYEKFDTFIEKHLEPFVYDYESVFTKSYVDMHGGYNEDSQFQAKDGELRVSVFHYIAVVAEKQKALEEFGMTELYPVLVS